MRSLETKIDIEELISISMSKLLVTGSRSIKDKQYVFEILDKTIEELSGIVELHHGGAVGVDILAAEWANDKGLTVYCHRPTSYVSYAYLVRDRVMVDIVDHVVAIWDGQSKGTAYTKQYAADKNKLRAVHIKK